MRRLYFLFVVLIFFCFQSNAQRIDPYSEVGLFLGTSYYLGDLNDVHFKLAQPAAAINYRYNIDRRFALRAGVWHGELRASDKLNTNDTVKINRNLHFKSPISEVSGLIEFNFFNYETGNRKYPFTPFVYTGISLFQFNPKARQTDTENVFDNDNGNGNPWIDLQTLGTEGQNSAQYPEKDNYQLIQFSIPIGVGLKISINDNFSLTAEYGARRTYTDYLDDVGGTYADPYYLYAENELAANLSDRSYALIEYLENNQGANITSWQGNIGKLRANENDWSDWYSFAGISIVYKIYTKPKVCKY